MSPSFRFAFGACNTRKDSKKRGSIRVFVRLGGTLTNGMYSSFQIFSKISECVLPKSLAQQRFWGILVSVGLKTP
ncbi:MAG: hypothetical protein C0507_17485 [Cyanobacteria bacterium PR.3.49]|nr:hypothetical protein [Cyanobacteria bacterium PR.3.49]